MQIRFTLGDAAVICFGLASEAELAARATLNEVAQEPDQIEPQPWRCPKCASEDTFVDRIEHHTGVVAPDGYKESATVEALICRSCNYVEEL